MNFFKKIIINTSLLFPTIAFAAPLSKTKIIFRELGNLIGLLIPIVFGLGLLLFFWGIAKYIWSAGGDKDEGKKIMVWGVVALFVMSSIWGLTTFLSDTLDLDEVDEMTVPTLSK